MKVNRKTNINTLNACSFQEPDCTCATNNNHHKAGKDAVEESSSVFEAKRRARKKLLCLRQQNKHVEKLNCRNPDENVA